MFNVNYLIIGIRLNYSISHWRPRSRKASRIVLLVRVKLDFLRCHCANSSSLGAEVLEASCDRGLLLSSGCKGRLRSGKLDKVNGRRLWRLPARARLVEVWAIIAVVEDPRLYFLFGLLFLSWRWLLPATWLGATNESGERVLKIVIFLLSDGSQTAAADAGHGLAWSGRLSLDGIEWLHFLDTPLTSLVLFALFSLFDVLGELGQAGQLGRATWPRYFLGLFFFLPFLLSHFESIQFLLCATRAQRTLRSLSLLQYRLLLPFLLSRLKRIELLLLNWFLSGLNRLLFLLLWLRFLLLGIIKWTLHLLNGWAIVSFLLFFRLLFFSLLLHHLKCI